MSIGRRQITNALDRIIHEELQKGRFPTLRTLMSRLNERFLGKFPGEPFFRIRPAKHRGTSNHREWNQMMLELDNDLRTLYEEHFHQADLLVRHFSVLDSKHRRLAEEIEQVHDRIVGMLLALDSVSGYFYTVGDDFHSLERIDLSKTSAWVHLQTGEVTPPVARDANLQVDLSQADIRIQVEAEGYVPRHTALSDPKHAVDDRLDTYWLHEAIVPEVTAVTFRYRLDFEPQAASRIVLNPQEAEPSLISVRVSSDRVNWLPLGSRISADEIVFDFPRSVLSAVEIIFQKDVFEDGPREDGYRYYAGLRRVALFRMGWEEKGTLVSVPYEVLDLSKNPSPLGQVSLHVDEDVPAGARIDYFVALDEPEPDWQPIAPVNRSGAEEPIVVNFNQVQRSTALQNIVSSSATLFGTYDGVDFFRLTTIPVQALRLIPESVRLIKGVNQWRREHYHWGQWTDPDYHVPSLIDWVDMPVEPSQFTARYFGLGTSFSLPAGASLNCRLMTVIQAPQETSLSWEIRSSAAPVGIRVYINNQPVAGGFFSEGQTPRLSVPLTLKAGQNSIQILVFRPQSSASTLLISDSLSGRGRIVVDPEPLRLVAPFDLFHNVPYRDDVTFTLVGPDVVINQYTKDQDARYEMTYRRSLTDPTQQRVLLRADLFSPNSGGPPPKLKGYRLLFGR